MRWFIAFILVAAAWFGLKDIALRAMLTSGQPSTPIALSYTAPEHWATQPEAIPPGAWETPWGIDAFIVLPPANLAHKHGLISATHEDLVTDALLALQTLSPAIPGETPAYAPFYRSPSPANRADIATEMNAEAGADLLAAFELYLAQANQGRGILLIMADSADAYSEPLIARLQADDLVSRFAGLVSFGPPSMAQTEKSLICAGILGGACHQQVETYSGFAIGHLVLPSLGKRVPDLTVIDATGVAAAIKVQVQNVSSWMDETQPKPAEPFFATQIIQSAPVFRPGADKPLDQPTPN